MLNRFQSIGYIGADYVGTNYVDMGTIIDTPMPTYPMQINIAKSQSAARTLGGTMYVYDRALTSKEFTMIIPKTPQTILNQIMSFFDNDMNGNQKELVWTDHLAVSRRVKLRGSVSVTPSGPIYNTVTLTLLEQVSA